MNRRLQWIKLLFVGWFLFLVIRLFYWQVIKNPELEKDARAQYGSSDIIPAPRGEIRSADGFPLVTNSQKYLAFIDPHVFRLDADISKKLFDLLPATSGAQKIITENRGLPLNWLPIAHGLSPDTKARIEQLQVPGLGFEEEQDRIYPEGSPSAYFTGFVGKNETGDMQGYFGLEGYWDRILSGKPGKLNQQLDAYNRPIVIGDQNIIPPQPGQNLITSVDRSVEYIVFKQLEAGLVKYQAKSGTVTVMDSKTGHLLAMVSLPGYDPGHFTDYPPDIYKNPIVSEGYEPGSTFKTIVMSSALDAGAVTPQTICEICSGPVQISGDYLRSYNNVYYPGCNMSDVILHSDNIGMVFVSRKLGKEKMLAYIRKFGFGQLTGVDLQEESTPVLRPDNQWYDIDWATAAFGQGIAVTRLQMVTAVNAIANGGQLIPPRVAIGTEVDGKIKLFPPVKAKKVISAEAAALMTRMMVNAVNHGEVRYYRVPGFSVAAKTGTAQIPIAGHYDPDKFIASFIGFAPAANPKFTMLVTLNHPQSSPWGSTTAAPLWFGIAEKLFRYFQIPPDSSALH